MDVWALKTFQFFCLIGLDSVWDYGVCSRLSYFLIDMENFSDKDYLFVYKSHKKFRLQDTMKLPSVEVRMSYM